MPEEFEVPLNMLYPCLDWVDSRGLIPKIYLPMDFKERVPKFYAAGGRKTIEDFAANVKEQISFSQPHIEPRLNWDEEKGLVNIIISSQADLTLNELGIPCFQEHNIGGMTALVGFAIATKYISELLSS